MAAFGYVVNNSDPDLLKLAGEDQSKVDRAINAGAFRIDSAFESAGYAIPIDVDQVTDDALHDRLEAFLDYLNLSLAAGILTRGSAGKKGTPENVRLNYDEAKSLLARIASGSLVVQGLTRSKSSAFRAVGDVAWKPSPNDDDETTFDDLFDTESVVAGGF